MDNQITIFLTDDQAKKFVEFQKNYETFRILQERGVFNIRNGNAVLHFDSFGVLQTIERGDILYARRFDTT